jgi:hypothetical protein
MDLLGQVFDAHVEQEIFAPVFHEDTSTIYFDSFIGNRMRSGLTDHVGPSMADVCDFVRFVISQRAGGRTLIFKLMIDQLLDLQIDLNRLQDEFDCKYIFLKRKNVFNVVVSRVRSTECGITHVMSGEMRPAARKVTISPKSLPRLIRDVELAYELIENELKFREHYMVEYENLCASPSSVLDGISSFLRFSVNREFRDLRVKISSGDPFSEVDNMQDILDYLSSSDKYGLKVL